MNSDEYANYLKRIMQTRSNPGETMTLQIELSVLRYVEAATERGVMIDRAWFERRLAESAHKADM